MSFKFNWGGFPPEFTSDALEMLTQALNKGANKPPNLVGPIVAKELDLGSNPPQLDILEISELESDRFRAMFRMKYSGDGFLVLQTQVQANPLRLPPSAGLPGTPSLGLVAAAAPLVVPMLLRISGLRLHGIVVLAVSKSDGITLVFRSDPLVSVEVHSTFDSVPSVRRMLQREIEATLRMMFQEDLPLIVHEMSVREIRRGEERRERARREGIERRQREIRRRRGARSAGGSVDAGEGLVAEQLHRRLREIEQGYAGSVRSAETAPQPRWRAEDMEAVSAAAAAARHAGHVRPGGVSMSGDALTLEQFLHDDWERTQRQESHAGGGGGQSVAEEDLWTYPSGLRSQGNRADEFRHGAANGQATPAVVLRPSENAGAARLASLMAMGQTLSPYTRRFEHTTMRADVNLRAPPPAFALDAAAAASSPPLSPPALAAAHRQPSFGSAYAAAATPFSATTTPPSGSTAAALGARSPFARNRRVRRKVHRLGGSKEKEEGGANG
ncbi:ERMES complex subunit [Coemansia erecta]|uniref:ERMES complex subunit n=1 Tax=Coemansia erecta TaxID=147472 RepID=A0A9W7Y1J4_9FUNG|nr:ERMES complex subunit [Coemansia erecta]